VRNVASSVAKREISWYAQNASSRFAVFVIALTANVEVVSSVGKRNLVSFAAVWIGYAVFA